MARRGIPLVAQLALAGGLGMASVMGIGSAGGNIAAISAAAQGASCTIKGNVSISSGEHIYHVPGQRYYGTTVISPEFGERWFCSEQDARAAGWRKSKV